MSKESISTKKGDQGVTSLFTGERIKKYSQRPEVYGTLDEASSFIGLARANCKNKTIQSALFYVQKHLYLINAELACSSADDRLPKKLEAKHLSQVEKIEKQIEEQLQFPKKFIIYGERVLSAQLDIARAVIRRAERRLVELAEKEDIRELIIKYINRLSDLLYLLARFDEYSNKTPYRFASDD